MWDFSSLTKDQTWKHRVLTTGLPEKSLTLHFRQYAVATLHMIHSHPFGAFHGLPVYFFSYRCYYFSLETLILSGDSTTHSSWDKSGFSRALF